MDTTNFEKLPYEKQQAILSAGILCFGRSGYEKTAISEIAKEAGISKAAVFHYFSTKQNLFIYLVKYARSEVEKTYAEGREDYFESLAFFIQAHFQLIKRHPGMYEFTRLVNELVANQSLHPLTELSQGYKEKNMNTIFANVDWSKFRDDYDRTIITNLTLWIGNGCLMELGKTLSPEDFFTEIKRYLAIIKNALYKPDTNRSLKTSINNSLNGVPNRR